MLKQRITTAEFEKLDGILKKEYSYFGDGQYKLEVEGEDEFITNLKTLLEQEQKARKNAEEILSDLCILFSVDGIKAVIDKHNKWFDEFIRSRNF